MKKILLLIIASLGLITSTFAGSPLIAFPGAEGFGKYAVGGRGGKVVAVTNLQDYKSTETPIVGSLRWALNQHIKVDSVYKDAITPKYPVTRFTPLTIVFKVSGTIWLKEDLKVKRDSLTIAGQTAPGDGICIAGRSVLFNGATGGEMFYWGPRRRELIVRHIRFRPGIPKDANGVPTGSYVTYGADMENYENVILDHCTMSWANEECLATYDTKNVSVQWCLVSEGLYNAYHAKGTRAYGGVWGGQFASYHHNIIAHNLSRTARFNGSRAHDTLAIIEYRNNVIYNWGNTDAVYGGEIEINNGRSEINLINNYYKKGPAYSFSNTVSSTNKGHRLLYCYDTDTAAAKPKGKHYITGNYAYGYPTVSLNNWEYGVQFKNSAFANDSAKMFPKMRLTSLSPEVIGVFPTSIETAESSFTNVLAGAGAYLPVRDAQDKRVLNEISTGTATGSGSFGSNKGIIDNPAVVGGWPVLNTGVVPTDTDNDGMPDAYETSKSLNPNDSIDGNGIDASGYTNLEVYLNSIGANSNFLQAPFNLKASYVSSTQAQLNWVDNSDIEDNYELQRSVQGVSGFRTIATLAAGSTSYTDNLPGDSIFVYRVRATKATDASAFSNEATFLQAPEFESISLSANKPLVKWYDLSNAETAYNVYRSTTGTNDFTLITTLAANATSYTDANITENITYYYKVAAVMGSKESVSTQTVSIKPIFIAPTALAIVVNANNKPTLTWTDNSAIEDGYEIQRTISSPVAYLPLDTVVANSTSFIDTTAVAGTSYIYKVRALSGTSLSGFTSAVTIAVPTTAINETKIEGLRVYPNPLSSVMNIEANEDILSLEIISVGGLSIERREPNSKTMSIAVDNLPQGIYTLKISARSGKQEIVKVLK